MYTDSLPVVAVGGSQPGEFRLAALIQEEGVMQRVVFMEGGEREFFISPRYKEELIPKPCILAPMRVAWVGTQKALPGISIPDHVGEDKRFKISKGSYALAKEAFPEYDSDDSDTQSDSSYSVEIVSKTTETNRPTPTITKPKEDHRSSEDICVEQASSSISAIHGCVFVKKFIAKGASTESDIRGAEYRVNLFEQKIATMTVATKYIIRSRNENKINEIMLALQAAAQHVFLRAAAVFSKLGGPTDMMKALFLLSTSTATDQRLLEVLTKCLSIGSVLNGT